MPARWLISCGVFARQHRLASLPDKVAIQLNDTHPAMAVPELMRILLDEEKLGWDDAWDITQRTLAYTNHTLLPEALEKWPLALVRRDAASPAGDYLRNQSPLSRRCSGAISWREATRRPRQPDRRRDGRKIRMANLAIVGSHSTNGVAAIHSDLFAR